MDDDKRLNGIRQLETFPLIVQKSSEIDTQNADMDDEALSAARAEELDQLLPEIALPSGFHYEEDWLVFQKESNKENPPDPVRICSRLEVVARTRNQEGENHGRLLRFPDSDGVVHLYSMPMELLAGDGSEYKQVLLSKGLLIAPGTFAKQQLVTFIQTSLPAKTIRCVEQIGWNKERTAFVFQNRTVGNTGKEPLILQTKSNLPITQTVAGSLEEWRQIADLCVGNSRLIFSVSAAFTPPLLLLLGVENGGIHFRGGSSSGKTTCLRVAASVWGSPDSVQQWRATVNGLEGIASAHNDCLLCLDEMGQMDANEIGNAAYMLANGTGKLRGHKSGDSRPCKQWRLLFLSSGEISLNDHMLKVKQRARAGQEVRVLDIPADGQMYGCFQNLHGFELPKTFAEHLSSLCKSQHGTAGLRFIELLLPIQSEATQKIIIFMNDLSKKHVPADASGQVHRAFNRFALIAAAGELATKFGITDWEEGTATKAAISCFNDWLIARGDMGPQEEREILSQVKHFFEQHGDSRFAPWNEDDSNQHAKTIMRAGYRRKCEYGYEFFVFPETFKKDIAIGYDPALVARICLKHRLLMPDLKDGATRSERLPDSRKSKRVYRFTPLVLAEGEEEVDE